MPRFDLENWNFVPIEGTEGIYSPESPMQQVNMISPSLKYTNKVADDFSAENQNQIQRSSEQVPKTGFNLAKVSDKYLGTNISKEGFSPGTVMQLAGKGLGAFVGGVVSPFIALWDRISGKSAEQTNNDVAAVVGGTSEFAGNIGKEVIPGTIEFLKSGYRLLRDSALSLAGNKSANERLMQHGTDYLKQTYSSFLGENVSDEMAAAIENGTIDKSKSNALINFLASPEVAKIIKVGSAVMEASPYLGFAAKITPMSDTSLTRVAKPIVSKVVEPMTTEIKSKLTAAPGSEISTKLLGGLIEWRNVQTENTKSSFLTDILNRLSSKKTEKAAVKVVGEEAVKLPNELSTLQSYLKSITPIRVLASNDLVASDIAIRVRNAILKQGNAYQSLYDSNWNIIKKFKGDKTKLIDYQESGVDINNVPAEYRQALTAIRNLEKKTLLLAQQSGIDTSAWRFTTENHFSHIFKGDQVIIDNGKIVDFPKNRTEGLINIVKYKNAYPNSNPVLRPREELYTTTLTNKPKTIPTGLSQKGYFKLINQVAELLETTPKEAMEELNMRGIAKIKTAKTNIMQLKYRTGKLTGYIKDPTQIYPSLFWKLTKKLHLEPTLRSVTLALNKIKDPELKSVMSAYLDEIGGKYKKDIPLGVQKFITGAQGQLKLGGRLSPAVVNTFQRLYSISITGAKNFVKAQKDVFTPEGQMIVEKLGVSIEAPLYESFGRQVTKNILNPLYIFGKTESGRVIGNRAVAGVAGYYWGKTLDLMKINAKLKELKLPIYKNQEALALDTGRATVDATQFRYDISDMPAVFRSGTGKILLQFKNYSLNQLSNLSHIVKGEALPGMERFYPKGLSNWQKTRQAIVYTGTMFSQGGLKALGFGIERMLPIGVIVYLATKAPVILYGLSSIAGIDISASASIELANFTSSIPLSDAQKIQKAITEKNPQYLLQIAPEAYRIYKGLEAIEDEGWLHDMQTGDRIVQLSGVQIAAYMVGLNPLKVSQEYELYSYMNKKTTQMNTETARYKRDIIDAYKSGDMTKVTDLYVEAANKNIIITGTDLSKEFTDSQISRLMREVMQSRKILRPEFLQKTLEAEGYFAD